MADVFGFSKYDNELLSKEEKESINRFRQMAQEGAISWEEANGFAEFIREQHGYSGGADGSGFTKVATPQATVQTQKAGGTTYADYLKSAEAKALQERYEHAGKLAMQDTVGDVSARTGGLASSYAGVAGQQVYGEYMRGLEDVQQDAFDRNLTREQQRLALQQSQEQTAYQKYLNQLTMDENKAKTLAAYGDFSGYKALGYTDEQIANMQKVYKESLVPVSEDPMYADDVIAVATQLGITPAEAQSLKNLGASLWHEEVEKLGISNESKLKTRAAQEIFSLYNVGEIDEEEALVMIRQGVADRDSRERISIEEEIALYKLLGLYTG